MNRAIWSLFTTEHLLKTKRECKDAIISLLEGRRRGKVAILLDLMEAVLEIEQVLEERAQLQDTAK